MDGQLVARMELTWWTREQLRQQASGASVASQMSLRRMSTT